MLDDLLYEFAIVFTRTCIIVVVNLLVAEPV